MNEQEVKHPEPPGQEMTPVVTGVEPGIPSDLIRQQLERLLTSPLFAQSPRASRFLRFVVEATLDGRGSELKEYVVGIAVFDRKESYDPRIDPIVRVEAVRLREKIRKYNETLGQNDAVRIELPKRSYVPLFRRVEAPDTAAVAASTAEPPEAPAASALEAPATAPSFERTRPSRQMVWLWAAMAATLVAVAGMAYWMSVKPAGIRPAGAGNRDPAHILVLPFTHATSQDEEEYFSAGLRDELINTLTRVETLRIVPTYAFRDKGQAQDIRKISEDLNAGTVIGGSVHRANNRVRVTIQISDIGAEHAIWSESFERAANDVLTLPEEISTSVIAALRKRVPITSASPLAGSRTKNAEAYALYVKGRYHWNHRSESSVRRAIEYFETALKQDPQYALAYSGLADCYALLAHIGSTPPGEVMPKAKAAALKALELDRSLPEAYSSLGYVAFFYDWDWPAAERYFQRAIELNPQYTPARLWYSSLLMSSGQREESIQQRFRAEQIDPLSPTVARFVADGYYHMGAYDEAIRKCQEALELDPNFGSAYVFLGRAWARKGMHAEAIGAFQKAAEISGESYRTTAMIAHSYAAWGKREQAVTLLRELEQRALRQYIDPFYIALVYVGLGDKQQTLAWLQKAFSAHSVWVALLPVDPNFNGIRKEPEFEALVRNLRPSTPDRRAL